MGIRRRYIILIIITLFIFVVFFSLRTIEPVSLVRGEIIAAIENYTGSTMEVGEVELWPLNRVVLSDVQLTLGESVFHASHLEIYYDLVDLFHRSSAAGESLDLIIFKDGGFRSEDYHLEEMTGRLRRSGKQIALNLEPGTFMREFKFADFTGQNCRLGRAGGSYNVQDGSWKGNINLAVDEIENQLSGFLAAEGVKDFASGGSLDLSLEGKGESLKEYSGRMELTEASMQTEEIDFLTEDTITDLSGTAVFNSSEERLLLEDMDFRYAGNPFEFRGYLAFPPEEEMTVEGELTSSAYELGAGGINLDWWQDLSPSGLAEITMYLKGPLSGPETVLDLETEGGELDGREIDKFVGRMRFIEDRIYVSGIELDLASGGRVEGKGRFQTEGGLFQLDLSGSDISSELVNDYLEHEQLSRLDSKADFDIMLSGKGASRENLQGKGSFELAPFIVEGNKFEEVAADFWLLNDRLRIEAGNLLARGTEVGFSGEFLPGREELNLDLKAEDIRPGDVAHYFDTGAKFKGSGIDFSGNFQYDADGPQLQGEVKSEQFDYKEHQFDDLSARLEYSNNKIAFNSFSFINRGAEAEGDGEISFSSDFEPDVWADMSVNGVSCGEFQDLLDSPLPLSGTLDGSLLVEGEFPSLSVTGNFSGEETEVEYQDNDFTLDSLNLDFAASQEEIIVEEVAAKLDEASFRLDGEIVDERLNLAYQMEALDTSYLGLESDFGALIDTMGTVSGKIDSPSIEGEFMADNVRYSEINLNQIQGKLHFAEDSCVFSEGQWDPGGGNVDFSGEVNSLSSEPDLDFEVVTEDTDLEQLLHIAGMEGTGSDFEYSLSGGGRLQGPLDGPEFSGEAQARGEDGGTITAQGRVGSEAQVELTGSEVEIGGFMEKILPEHRFSGTTDFEGEISGVFPDWNYNFDTRVNEVEINGHSAGTTTGSVNYRRGRGLCLSQNLKLEGQEILNLEGDVFFTSGTELDLDMTASDIPLGIMTNFFPTVNGDGYLRGNASIGGTLEEPRLGGDMKLAIESLDLIEINEKITDFSGDIDFEDRAVILSDFKGQYDGGVFELGGTLDPFAPEDFWSLDISGTDLYFDYGSYRGRFDPEVEVVGPLFVPLIRGDLQVHDFTAFLPHEWPESEEEGLFTPELDLTLNAGRNISLRSENINVPVQQGELVLTYLDEEFNIEGLLTSSQGSFDYYNNKFLVEEAEAEFVRYAEGIPELDVEAWTTVGNTRIQINLSGPAENMETTFSSEPSMEEDEILELLVSKGGLGPVVREEEETTLMNIVSREIMRFVQETFQLDVIGSLEENFAEYFELDRVDINAYQLGPSQELDLYLGKNLSQKVYLEYVANFTPELEEDEISFIYYLQDNVFLEGTWEGEDSYRFTVETTFDF
ncbi:MAG: translocation/assembly module TamB domain-containing protein [Halanaerobiaceae bacterium]